ncbi:MAG: hypothetical protein IPG35_01930 [Flavobacteriales bacterium]|nr:hypothetical protein [Flavobacteriales bacterium]MBK8950611.1 hypothetical protein [Flavobacteriales bacterium]
MRSLALPALLLGVVAHAQTAHLIRGLDHYFQPDTLVMVVGDSVRFQTQQMHNMVQVSEANWLLNFAIPNGGFQTALGQDSTFAIDTAGTYHFVCEPHGFMGMKGVLLVAPNAPMGSPEVGSDALHAYPNPATDRLIVPLRAVPATVRIIAPTGAVVAIEHVLRDRTISLPTGHLPPGGYLLTVEDARGVLRSRVSVVD